MKTDFKTILLLTMAVMQPSVQGLKLNDGFGSLPGWDDGPTTTTTAGPTTTTTETTTTETTTIEEPNTNKSKGIPPTYNKLPEDAGNHLASAFLRYALTTAQIRGGVKKDPEDLRKTGGNERKMLIGKFKDEMPDLPDSVLDDIASIGFNAAWHTANTRAWFFIDANRDKRLFNEAADRVEESPYISGELAYNIKWCAWNLAWFHANRKYLNFSAVNRDG